MIFVVNNDLTSSFLRGHHIAGAMGAKILFADIECARNQDVVFVKDADRGLVLDAKDRGNRIIYDVIDYYCYRGKRCLFGDLVDVLIVPNKACIEFYKPDFPTARFAVIPHQWDYRIKGIAPQDTFRPAYIGNDFNKPQFWTGPEITNPVEFLQAAPLFNLHLALQKRDAGLLKPSTKISTAAAVGANVVTYADPGAVELLGNDYPYIVRDDPAETIAYAQKTFGGPIWKRALDRMSEAKEKTSLSAVVELYRKLDVNELREVACQ